MPGLKCVLLAKIFNHAFLHLPQPAEYIRWLRKSPPIVSVVKGMLMHKFTLDVKFEKIA